LPALLRFESPRSRTAGIRFPLTRLAVDGSSGFRFRARAYSIMPLFSVARLKLCAIRYVSIDRRLRLVYRSVRARFLRLPNNRSLFVPRAPRNIYWAFSTCVYKTELSMLHSGAVRAELYSRTSESRLLLVRFVDLSAMLCLSRTSMRRKNIYEQLYPEVYLFD